MTSSSDYEEREHDAPASDSAAAFAFVSELAKEVSSGKVELPSFPDVAVRVRKVLGDEHVANEQIARIVGSDAGLAARVLTLANSAALESHRSRRRRPEDCHQPNRPQQRAHRCRVVRDRAAAPCERAAQHRAAAGARVAGGDDGRRAFVFDRLALPAECRRVDARRPAAQRGQAVHPGPRQSPRRPVQRSGRAGPGHARLARQRRQGDRRELGVPRAHLRSDRRAREHRSHAAARPMSRTS